MFVLPALFLFAAIPSQLTSSPDPDRVREARELVLAGKTTEAIALYGELVKASPNDPSLLLDLAITEYKAGRYGDSLRHSEAVLKLRPGTAVASLFLGASYLEMGEPARAVEPLEKALRALPADRNARAMLADALFGVERYEEAAGHYRRVAEANGSARAWYGLGRSYDALFRSALAELQEAAPDSAYRPALEGDLHFDRKQFGPAFEAYRQALARQPGLRGVYAALAGLYTQTGHADWAEAAAEKERRLPAPDCASRTPECDFLAGRLLEAVDSARAIRSAEARYWEGKAWAGLARQAFERLLALAPSRESHELAATLFEARGLFRQAVAEWRAALEFEPGRRRLRVSLAAALFQARDQAALPLVEGLLKEQPDSAELNFLYGGSLLNQERTREAIPYLERAAQLDAGLLPARAALGHALLREGKAAAAIPHLQASLSADEDGSRHFQLARAYQLTGQAELGRQALARYQTFLHALADKQKQAGPGVITGPENLR